MFSWVKRRPSGRLAGYPEVVVRSVSLTGATADLQKITHMGMPPLAAGASDLLFGALAMAVGAAKGEGFWPAVRSCFVVPAVRKLCLAFFIITTIANIAYPIAADRVGVALLSISVVTGMTGVELCKAIRPRDWTTVAMSTAIFVSVLGFLFVGGKGGFEADLWGLFLAIVLGVCYALRLGKVAEATVSHQELVHTIRAVSNAEAALVVGGIAAGTGFTEIVTSMSPMMFGLLVLLGIISTALPQWAETRASRKGFDGTSLVAWAKTLPVFAYLWEMAFQGEPFHPVKFVLACLIVVLAMRQTRRVMPA